MDSDNNCKATLAIVLDLSVGDSALGQTVVGPGGRGGGHGGHHGGGHGHDAWGDGEVMKLAVTDQFPQQEVRKRQVLSDSTVKRYSHWCYGWNGLCSCKYL